MAIEREWVYFVLSPMNNLIKIGYTARPFALRLGQLRSNSPSPLIVLGVMVGSREKEREIHHRFLSEWSHGEWFHDHKELRQYVRRHARKQYEDEAKPSRPAIGRDYGKSVSITIFEWSQTTWITYRGQRATAATWAKRSGRTIWELRKRLELGVHPENLFMVDVPPDYEVPYKHLALVRNWRMSQWEA